MPGEVPPIPIPDHTLIRRIGKGSYGEVWLARNVLGVYRAVKIIHRESFDDDRPFEREFAGMQRFEPVSRSHETQLNILQVGRGPDCFYYVMELADDMGGAYASGGTISASPQTSPRTPTDSKMGTRPSDARGDSLNPDTYTPRNLRSELLLRGRLPVAECLRLGLALTTALENLHRHGLVHRDIKPSNIVFVNGIPKLADIGLVALAESTMSFVGTEGYLPPEGPGTVQADLFSLGKVLYEISTGHDRQQFPELPTGITELPDRAALAEFNEVLLRACAPDVKQRYETAAEMHADLALLQSGKSVARMRRTERQLRFVSRAGAIVTVVAAVIAAGWLWQAHQTRVVRELADDKGKLAQESRQRLVQLQTANGIRAMDSEDPATAALWFSEVLKVSQGDPAAEARQRFRLGTLFRYLPKPIGLFHSESTLAFTGMDDEGKRLMAVGMTPGTAGSRNGEIKVWELASCSLVNSIHLTNISVVRVSRSGRWAIVSDLNENRLCKVGSELQFVSMLPFSGRSALATFAEDETRLAISSLPQGREVRIIEIPSGRSLTPPLMHSNNVVFLAFDREGRQLVTGTTVKQEPDSRPKGQARVWNAITGEPITDWLECDEEVGFATFSPDGSALAILGKQEISTASGLTREMTKVFDLPSGRLRFPPLAHKNSVLDAEFSPDGFYLATACADRTVTLWHARSGEAVHPPLKHPDTVEDVCFSPDGRWLATIAKTEVYVWDVRSGVMVAPPLKHNGRVRRVGFSPDGSRLITGVQWGPILVWDLADAEPGLPPFRATRWGTITSATFAPDGDRVVTTEGGGHLQVWNTADGQPSLRGMEPKRERNVAQGLQWNQASWSADERWLAVPSGDSTVRIWDALTGEPHPTILRHSNLVLWAEFSPITNHLVTASADGTARVWDAATGVPVTPPLQHSNEVRKARFSPDGRRIATASADRTARVWDAATGAPVTPPVRLGNSVYDVAFSPDGSRIATASQVGTAWIWDATTGEKVAGRMGHLGSVIKVCFSPNGQYLLTASMDQTARVWDARTGQPVTPPLTHGGYVLNCAFSPDGSKVVSASHDGTARIWDAATGEPLCMPFRHGKEVMFASFNPDGQVLVTSSEDGTAQLWEVPTLDWSVNEADALAQLVAGGKVGQPGTVDLLDGQQLDAAWERVSERFHGKASASNKELARWHRRQLALCEPSTDWFAAEFHARRLRDLLPEDRAVREEYARILDYRPLPRDPATPANLVDLSDFYTHSLNGLPNRELSELPRGVQTLAGTPFDLRGIIRLQAEHSHYRIASLPLLAVPHIPMGRRCRELHFLQAVDGLEGKDGEEVARWVIHYADGSIREWPVIYGEHVRDWWWWNEEGNKAPKEASEAVIAWEGHPPIAIEEGAENVRLFKATWTNPAPDVEVRDLDFVLGKANVRPFVIAITAE